MSALKGPLIRLTLTVARIQAVSRHHDLRMSLDKDPNDPVVVPVCCWGR